MSRFPILLDLNNSNVLVAGTGHLAIAKIRLLLAVGASVTALVYDDENIEELFGAEIEIIKGGYTPEILNNKKLIYISKVSDDELKTIVKAAKELNIPYNHVDDPVHSSFTTPAIVQRGPITVSISTDGKAPVLSRNLRRKIEQLLPTDLGNLVELLHGYRPGVNKLIAKAALKLKFWNNIYSDREISTLLKLPVTQQRKRILKLIGSADKDGQKGHVRLVGAGPGDPELLTLKAHRALQEADVIIHDNLVSKDILNLSRRDAELIDVGKSRAVHKNSQDEINQIIVDHANKGLLVVRLKGGDPMIFGRVAEEIDALRNAGISYEIVPGITSAVGIAANSSIPLTHREHASMVTFATGQLKEDKTQNWHGLAGDGKTIAIYMGISTADETSTSLIRDGYKPETPVAIIENGTRENERRVYGELSQLGDLVKEHNVISPALLIVGEVVREADDFALPLVTPLKVAN
ncbi:siroheme synthase CysG [Pseudemcibacter aquimaris]|uniref:siroheme synthase CysG n=1 Tax=Pseudemcibacter aquimaris TaxID=2857064 RepID=UPI0020139F16|nr:siroheme synthase CysG [Pseudemcibacter aquimaris]MCC3861194.1 siroheme synthase CysG [Pseudemcibacter aquimaris]WDU57969.1 siroheme synthase CysG [Pseudemcibacter aquimaris]